MGAFEEFGISWILMKFDLDVDVNQDLFASGVLDSLSFNELLADAEKHFSQRFDFSDVDDWDSLGSLKGLGAALGL